MPGVDDLIAMIKNKSNERDERKRSTFDTIQEAVPMPVMETKKPTEFRDPSVGKLKTIGDVGNVVVLTRPEEFRAKFSARSVIIPDELKIPKDIQVHKKVIDTFVEGFDRKEENFAEVCEITKLDLPEDCFKETLNRQLLRVGIKDELIKYLSGTEADRFAGNEISGLIIRLDDHIKSLDDKFSKRWKHFKCDECDYDFITNKVMIDKCKQEGLPLDILHTDNIKVYSKVTFKDKFEGLVEFYRIISLGESKETTTTTYLLKIKER